MMIKDPDEETLRAWNQWVEERPEHVRAVARRFSPWCLYRYKPSNHRVVLYSFDEGPEHAVTLKVLVLHDFNGGLLFERRVFGIAPEDLEECPVPTPEELAKERLDALGLLVVGHELLPSRRDLN